MQQSTSRPVARLVSDEERGHSREEGKQRETDPRQRSSMPQRKARPQPRLFLLKWNNANAQPGVSRSERFIWHECWGCLYPNGRVSLDFGTPFMSMNELREHVSLAGLYLIQWLEEGVEEEMA